MFSASPEAMTSRASPWSRCPTLPKTTLCQFLAALSLFCILIEIILILFYLLYVSGYPDQRQGEVAIEEGNHLLPPPQGCKFCKIVLGWLYYFHFQGERKRKSVRGCIVDGNLSVISMAIIKKGEAEVIFMMNESNPSVGNKEIHLLRAHVSKWISLTNLTSPLIRSLDWPTTRSLAGWVPSAPARSGLCAWYASEYQDVLIMALL